jgi:DNA recombination protein RmuC
VDILYYILFLLVGALASYLFARNKFHKPGSIGADRFNDEVRKSALLNQELESLKQHTGILKSKIDEMQGKNTELVSSVARLETINQGLNEKLSDNQKELKELHKKFAEEFESIANKILLNNSGEIQRQHSQKLSDILTPLKEKINGFEKSVKVANEQNIRENESLKEQLKLLRDLNMSIGDEARNLTSALTGQVKTQGNWGELILETILEKSGLVKGREFIVQPSFTDEDGRRFQPDVLINLPENKSIIIDSKVSLVAYEKLANTKDEDEYNALIKDHLNSLRRHVKGLSEKKYQQLYSIKTLDFVLMFIPVEPAFIVAVGNDSSLFNDAFDKNIVLVSPSTLLATLRTISSIWKLEYQNQYARDIAKLSGSLYDKFAGFIDDMDDIDKKLTASHGSWENAMKKLSTGRGNIVSITERIKKLGAGTSKSIPKKYLNDVDDEGE